MDSFITNENENLLESEYLISQIDKNYKHSSEFTLE